MMVKPQILAFLRTVLCGTAHAPCGDPGSYAYGNVTRNALWGHEASMQGSSHTPPMWVLNLKSEPLLGAKEKSMWAAVWTTAQTTVKTHTKQNA